MILLLSSSDDVNLDLVIDWLKAYRYPYLRINADDLLEEDFHLSLTPPRIALRQQEVDLPAIGTIWLRKFGNFHRTAYFQEAETRLGRQALDQLSREYNAILNGLIALLEEKHWLTHPSRLHVNKIEMLHQAQKCGLTIPETHLINRREDLARLCQKGEYISKSIYEPLFLKETQGFYTMFTKVVSPEEVEGFSAGFFPSLIQRKVPKEYELRVFYLDGECYAMAIFSQETARTETDFRDIDWSNPNRNVPYALPPELTEGIRQFMATIGLNCGSLDLIKGTDGRYYFLEVNPMGQFGMVSFPCNYSLYEKIALYLIQHDRRQEEVR